jgi:mycoredoxin
MEPVVLYGTSWCAQTQLLRRHLERLSHPVVYVGGEVLVEPTLPELERALWRRGYLWRPW